MTKPLFSCAVICRNEEKTLPRLIGSLKEFLDRGGEMIIVDTGSKDNTVQVCKNLGITPHEVGDRFKKKLDNDKVKEINEKFVVGDEGNVVNEGDTYFDFAEARNYAASLATSNYISYADADEVFTSLNIDEVNKRIENGFGQFEYEFVFSHHPDGSPDIHFKQCKFYDKTKVKWVGIIHEVLQGNVTRTYLDESIYKLEHWQNMETNRSGYLKGLAIDCFENPDNDRNSHYFAREMFYHKKYKSAIKEFERHVAMNRWPAEKGKSLIFMGECYEALGDKDKAIQCYNESIRVESGRREPWIKLAEYSYRHDDKQRCACYAAASLEIPWSDFYANNNAHYTYVPHELLYWAEFWLGNKVEAKKHFDKCLEYHPFNPKYLKDTQFFYEYADHCIDGYMKFQELTWLYETAKTMNSILEIGSFKGRSTHALCSGCPGIVTAVDTFKGSGPGDWTHGVDCYDDFKKNMEGVTNVDVNKMSSKEASKMFKRGKWDLIFIDAGHQYEEVKEDIKLWKKKAKKIICGHDYLPGVWDGVVKAVNEEFGQPDEIHETIWVKYIK